jgi:HPt (histidine-containing phosphotransfer) domain-containing protein
MISPNVPSGYGKDAPFHEKAPSALDVEKGLSQVDGDVHLYRKIFYLYRKEMKADFVTLENGVQEGHWNLVYRMSHKFKGGAFTVGAKHLGGMARVLQRLAQDEETDLVQYFDLFQDELLRVYGEMERYLVISATEYQ